VDNFITIRVFLKVIDDSKNEYLKKLFLNTMPNIGEAAIPDTNNLNQTQSLSDHPVNCNGEDQVYIDVSNTSCTEDSDNEKFRMRKIGHSGLNLRFWVT
jgi:hypothetical protein